jgi:hypothetical protein
MRAIHDQDLEAPVQNKICAKQNLRKKNLHNKRDLKYEPFMTHHKHRNCKFAKYNGDRELGERGGEGG